jgi:hypothetical protein
MMPLESDHQLMAQATNIKKETEMLKVSVIKELKRTTGAALCIALLATTLFFAACSPQQGGTASDEYTPNPNATITQGESDTITAPDMLADGNSGVAISGNDEEELQQDRISGGANTGGVNSKHLDPLTNTLTQPKSERE